MSYGGHAKPFIPTLKELALDYSDGEPDFPMQLSQRKETDMRAAISKIEGSQELPELIRIAPAPAGL